MEDSRKRSSADSERDIVFSKAIKAGKRIYYIDVKKSRNDEMYISITESKKVIAADNAQNVSFEKHKIFLYKEDFRKFLTGLSETVKYIEDRQGPADYERHSAPSDDFRQEPPQKEEPTTKPEEIKFDIDF